MHYYNQIFFSAPERDRLCGLLFYFGVILDCWVGGFCFGLVFLSKSRHMTAMVGNLSKLLSEKGERFGWKQIWSNTDGFVLAAGCIVPKF